MCQIVTGEGFRERWAAQPRSRLARSSCEICGTQLRSGRGKATVCPSLDLSVGSAYLGVHDTLLLTSSILQEGVEHKDHEANSSVRGVDW